MNKYNPKIINAYRKFIIARAIAADYVLNPEDAIEPDEDYAIAVMEFLDVCQSEGFLPPFVLTLKTLRDAYTAFNTNKMITDQAFDKVAHLCDEMDDKYEEGIQAFIAAFAAY